MIISTGGPSKIICHSDDTGTRRAVVTCGGPGRGLGARHAIRYKSRHRLRGATARGLVALRAVQQAIDPCLVTGDGYVTLQRNVRMKRS